VHFLSVHCCSYPVGAQSNNNSKHRLPAPVSQRLHLHGRGRRTVRAPSERDGRDRLPRYACALPCAVLTHAHTLGSPARLGPAVHCKHGRRHCRVCADVARDAVGRADPTGTADKAQPGRPVRLGQARRRGRHVQPAGPLQLGEHSSQRRLHAVRKRPGRDRVEPQGQLDRVQQL